MRGMAIIAVLIYHFFPDVGRAGFVGVDVFFVISGFVITNLLLRQMEWSRDTLVHFWGRRVRRLFPAMAIVLPSTLLAGWFVLWPAQYLALGRSTIWTSAMLGNVHAWMQSGYFEAQPTWNPLLNFWSLGVEGLFYLVWPLVLGFTVLYCRRYLILVVILLGTTSWFVATAHVGFAHNTGKALSGAFYLPWFRIWEFCAGALIASLSPRSGPRTKPLGTHLAWRWAYAALSVALIVSLLVEPRSINPATYALPAVVITSALILVGTYSAGTQGIVGNRFLLWFGKISYPLYLWHWPVLSLTLSAGADLGVRGSAALVLLSTALAYLTWQVLERPVQKRRVTCAMVLGLCVPVAASALAGYGVARTAGVKQRTSEFAHALDSYSYDYAADYRLGTCFHEVASDETVSRLENCIVAEPSGNNVLLWGDSYAAHLYPGLAEAGPAGMSISQITAAACPPMIMGDDAPADLCSLANGIAKEAARSGNIDQIVLASGWHEHGVRDLDDTLSRLELLTDARVIVVGPGPNWQLALSRNWSFFEASRMTSLPEYAKPRLIAKQLDMGEAISETAEQHGAEYFDMIDTLCVDHECLVRTGPGIDTLTTWDHGHLTRRGSRVVATGLVEVLTMDPSAWSHVDSM